MYLKAGKIIGGKSLYYYLSCAAALGGHDVLANDYSGKDRIGIEFIVDEVENGLYSDA